MERIVIEVNDAIAKKWRFTTLLEKERLSREIDRLLSVSLSKPKDNFWEFIEQTRKEAIANGISEEELNKLLNED